jgi:hypothetical protein
MYSSDEGPEPDTIFPWDPAKDIQRKIKCIQLSNCLFGTLVVTYVVDDLINDVLCDLEPRVCSGGTFLSLCL